LSGDPADDEVVALGLVLEKVELAHEIFGEVASRNDTSRSVSRASRSFCMPVWSARRSPESSAAVGSVEAALQIGPDLHPTW